MDTGIRKSGNEFCELAGPDILATIDKDADELLGIAFVASRYGVYRVNYLR